VVLGGDQGIAAHCHRVLPPLPGHGSLGSRGLGADGLTGSRQMIRLGRPEGLMPFQRGQDKLATIL
jgi:hypothetical protein